MIFGLVIPRLTIPLSSAYKQSLLDSLLQHPSCSGSDPNCVGTGCLPRQRRLLCVLFRLNLRIPILRHRSRNILNHGLELMD
jgi:hypothetical protein